jgi:hypothetical protein
LVGAQQAGVQIEKVLLSKVDIKPCRACEACKKAGTCVQQDDLPLLLDKLRDSQVWVLGTPIYFLGPTAQLKALIDRFYGIKNVVKGRRIILTIPMEDSNTKTAPHTVGMFKDALDWLQAELFAIVLAPGVLDPGEIRNHPDVLTAARRAGREAFLDENEKLIKGKYENVLCK